MTPVTIVLKVDPINPEVQIIKQAAKIVESGRIIVYPTDTIYGVGTNALDPIAVHRIFDVKSRPLGTPLPVAVGDIVMAEKLAAASTEARRLMEFLWPGALTLVLPKRDIVPDVVTAGRIGLALRMPNHQIPLKIIEASGLPLIATSANLHGAASCKTAQEAVRQIGDRVDIVLDGGLTARKASTVLDLTGARPKILREGPVTRMMLRQFLGYDVD